MPKATCTLCDKPHKLDHFGFCAACNKKMKNSEEVIILTRPNGASGWYRVYIGNTCYGEIHLNRNGIWVAVDGDKELLDKNSEKAGLKLSLLRDGRKLEIDHSKRPQYYYPFDSIYNTAKMEYELTNGYYSARSRVAMRVYARAYMEGRVDNGRITRLDGLPIQPESISTWKLNGEV